MNLKKINTLYFLGIGGIGMSALARFFLLQGKQVYGYDLTSTEITSQLISEGAHIHFEEDISQIPSQVDMVVFTPAIPTKHKEYQYFINRKTPLFKRSEILGILSSPYPTIAIAGTHGKTTTTAMLTQMLVCRDVACNVSTVKPSNILSFIGGISKNFNSNFVYDPDFDTVIAEADEFDRSFLTLHPQVAVITSMDADHLDIYKSREQLKTSFQLFADQMQPNGVLIIYDEIAEQIEHPKKVTYGFSEKADYQISNIQYFAGKTMFYLEIHHSDKLPRPSGTPSKFEGDFRSNNHLIPTSSHHLIPTSSHHLILKSSHHLIINVPGKHNVLNAVAAIAACLEFLLWKNGEVDISYFIQKLADFNGVKRRFDIRIQREDLVYIDDYAHHPEEIRAFLEAVKKSYPNKKITGIFQPHLYSRTRDFAQEFAYSLEVLDEILLLDIYPAREKPIEGITSDYLLSIINNKNKKLLKKEELVPYLKEIKPEVLLTMGAGDIDRLVSIFELKL
jgi:UDP-N-acetylmuramate--alanine ligase